MIHFFGAPKSLIYGVQSEGNLSVASITKLTWLFNNQPKINVASIDAFFIGPRASMTTPWSTNAVEICQNMGITNIVRIEKFKAVAKDDKDFDPMLFQRYKGLDQHIYQLNIQPEVIHSITNIAAYNIKEGLALNDKEIQYLENLSKKLKRPLTDSEVFGFSQVNSEHCRHKIFNGIFIIDGVTQPTSLFKLIKETSRQNPNTIVSAYKDNVAFIKGPVVEQFAPKRADIPDFYDTEDFESIISLKAETHNFPTTVEPFNGAATGSGGEIRDRLAGGKGSIPLAGTAVYMTSYPRLENDSSNTRAWEKGMKERPWLYQTPVNILIKASNGASDFGNKFGQPLICGSVFTFEHDEHHDFKSEEASKPRKLGYDKVIMQAGGIGYGKLNQALKDVPNKGDKIVILGGDNYRIGMGGASVSSTDTGEYASGIELNAVQRSNPEMQKRTANTIRGMVESKQNPIVSIHDHGAGGHLNCLSELVEESGGTIDLDQLPVGDATLSYKELIGNESQERMGLLIAEQHLDTLQKIANRERSPIYTVGKVTGNQRLTFQSKSKGSTPIDLELKDFFGSSPTTIMKDSTVSRNYSKVTYDHHKLNDYLEQVLQLESVACKDWLTNKVDRCVSGKVAKQQCVGPLQLPLNNCGVMALDYNGNEGIATSIGHSPISGLINPEIGSRNSITESLNNLIWAPLKEGIKSVSLSANWMWPCNNEGEDARLFKAVKAVSEFAIALGINVPTGKDSLSMKQKYKEEEVIAPGTVIISAAANCNAISNVVEPVFKKNGGPIYYINISLDTYKLGGSAFAQITNKIGEEAPDVTNPSYVKLVFNTIQELIKDHQIITGHDVASGGLITTLLEMCFADTNLGADLDLSGLKEKDTIKLLFSENSGLVFQAKNSAVEERLRNAEIQFVNIGKVIEDDLLRINNQGHVHSFSVPKLRDVWYKTSFLLDQKQTANNLARARYDNYKLQPLVFKFPKYFSGEHPLIQNTSSLNVEQHVDVSNTKKPKAAILREKGSNSEREMAYAMYLAGFDVKDVHMTDLISGRETLENIQFIGSVGGFSNSDVLGSAKGWAGAFKYNEKANTALKNFFKREDTLSVGICNGCQLWMELELINPEHDVHGKMTYNDSQKHESAFTSVTIERNHSVMLSSLAGSRLGVWISHGEGKFNLPLAEEHYHIVAKYGYKEYPANPNGSSYNTAMLCDKTGRHLVTMPHIERSIFPWNWAHYPDNRNDDISPWIEAFINARQWIEKKY